MVENEVHGEADHLSTHRSVIEDLPPEIEDDQAQQISPGFMHRFNGDEDLPAASELRPITPKKEEPKEDPLMFRKNSEELKKK